MKLGVLTGGSDAPGLNAVIRGVVRTAALRYGSDVVGVSHGFEGLLRPPEVWPLAPGDVRGLVRRGGTILGCNRGSPFLQGGEDRSNEIPESVRWLDLDALICIGGEGVLAIAERLHHKGVPVICVPKTIENDLPGTEVTFGYATAVALATSAIDVLQTTGESIYRVMYLEVTGRRAGWIALTAGMAGGADVVLIPEIPYRAEEILELILRRKERGKRSTIVVVAEGARAEGEEIGAVPAGEVAARVAARVAELDGREEQRVTVLGHLQRGGDPVPHDRILATRFGAAAVQAAQEGAFGTMIGVQGGRTIRVPLAEVIDQVRTLGPEHDLLWTATSLGISLGAATLDQP